MPEMRYFVVTQTREVKVVANHVADAVLIADAAFKHGQNSDSGVAGGKGPEGVWGNTRSLIRETSIVAKEEE